MKENTKWLTINRKHRTYWVSEEEDKYIRQYLEEQRGKEKRPTTKKENPAS